MKLLILAQNPKTPNNVKDPLKGTKSWTILKRWLDQAKIPESALEIRNTVQLTGASTDVRKLVKAKLSSGGWMEEIIGYPVIVCLGRYAEQAVKETRNFWFPNVTDWDHYFLPHPSGLNRILNDPEAHADAVAQLENAYKKLLTLKLYEARMS